MGKSDINPMPLNRQESLFGGCKVAFNLKTTTTTTSSAAASNNKSEEKVFKIPDTMQRYNHQVSGHKLGMMKNKGTVLKPILNKTTFLREVEFYENMERTNDKTLMELREFIPKYYGKVTIPINGINYNCIILEDLTENYKEPCIMDVKIGKRTWDPEATYEKIVKEESKYQSCKRDLSFCIPGFQVYKIYDNELLRFDKDFGKKLDKETVKQALKTFLNGEEVLCRALIVQFLSSLWRIQHWVRNQRKLQLFSSSLLLVYDARRLREVLKINNNGSSSTKSQSESSSSSSSSTTLSVSSKIKLERSTSLYRPVSMAVGLNEKIPTGFSGLCSKEGPILTQPPKIKQYNIVNNNSNNNNNNEWKKSISTLKRTHSFHHNYDKDVQSKKQDYTFILEELVDEEKNEIWASVKMIDFAHAYPWQLNLKGPDRNYLDGIDNLIRIFEEFLTESE